MSMLEIDGKLISVSSIETAEIETRHYMNGTVSWLVIRLKTGREIRRENALGFDAFAALKKIKDASTPRDPAPTGTAAAAPSPDREGEQ